MNNDLISRSALMDDIQADVDYGGVGGMVGGALKRYVKRAPAVDAVIPVRCKGCEYVYEYQPAGCGRVALFCENENAPWYTTEHAIFVEENGVEADPVRHGYWENANGRPKTYIRKCSVCGKEAYFCGRWCSYKFCPNCGSKMEGESDE